MASIVSIGIRLNLSESFYCSVCEKKSKGCHLMSDGGVRCEACAQEFEREFRAKEMAAKIASGWDDDGTSLND